MVIMGVNVLQNKVLKFIKLTKLINLKFIVLVSSLT